MDAARWQLVWSLFFEAAELAPPERAALLAERASDDQELRREVEALLAAHEQESSLLMQPPVLGDDLPDDDDGAPPDRLLGAQVGPYHIERVIGEGGMGTVYEAEQTLTVRRRVALKVIKLGMDTRDVVRRFEAERQALALMTHPNIARVYDAGATDDGRPYFVMELVSGESLTSYCDSRRLSLRERLRLVVTLCDAIQHAHQKGVVHRDLKPSNVLIDTSGRTPTPKVIDFGIAKAVGAQLTEQTLATAAGFAIGTPAYMSPEQAAFGALDIDTRSDVYSLCALLHELLVGEPPFPAHRTGGSSYLEALRQVRETPAPRPSAQFETLPLAMRESVARERSLNLRELGGQLHELDWIVLKGLAKDREQRYATPQELAADLTRFLEGQPVLARPPSRWYRTRKFVARHRVGVAASSAIALLVLALAISMTVQSLRLERALTAEARQRARAEQVSGFLVNLLQLPDPYVDNGSDLTVRAALDAGVARIDTELAGEPVIKAQLLQTMGFVYRQLGLYDTAQQLLDQALALHRQIDDPRGHGSTLVALGELKHDQGDLQAARRYYLDGLARLRASANAERDIASALNDLTQLYSDTSALADAERAGREAVALRRAVLGSADAGTAQSIQNLARVLKLGGRLAESDTLYQQALGILRAAGHDDDPLYAVALNHHGLLQRDRGEAAAALATFGQALAIFERTLPATHSYLASTLNNLATVNTLLANYAISEQQLSRALGIWQSQFGATHYLVTQARYERARVWLQLGRYDAAARELQQLIVADTAASGADSVDVANDQDLLGWAERERGRLAEAERQHRSALALRTAALGAGHMNAALSKLQLALTLIARNQPDEAEQLIGQASARFDGDAGVPPLRKAAARNALARLRAAQGRAEEAAALYREVLALRLPLQGERHPEVAEAPLQLATLLCRQPSQRAEGQRLLTQAVGVLAERLGASHPQSRRARAAQTRCTA